MADIMVDSNVILDVVTEDPKWYDWSAGQLEKLAESHTLVINPIIYSEVSIGFDRIENLDRTLPPDFFRRDPLPWEAGFLAGKCFVKYRRSGCKRHSPQPDYNIGAHAAIQGIALLTRDTNRYKTWFPQLALIAP